MGIATEPEPELAHKIEVLRDLEEPVRELRENHERKRELWFPSDLLAPEPEGCPEDFVRRLRDQADGIPDPIRAALALNMLTEEGLPHFHRLLAVYLGDDSHWRAWNNLWTAEEDRHGQVLHDYCRDTRLFDQRKIEEMQFEYLRRGFHPEWDKDPYRVFAYTTVQERATQFSHAETGRIVGEYEPRLAEVLSHVAKDEARH
jgi:acyl-[acyl-carrier-protein] desaturase